MRKSAHKNRVLQHDNAQEKSSEKLQKVTQKRNVHQDISDTLKSRLLKNTNIRHIGRVPEQIGRTLGQAAAVSFIFSAPKKVCARTRPKNVYYC